MQRKYFMEDGLFISQTSQDAQPVVDHARVTRETHGNVIGGKGVGRFVGSVPLTLYNEWLREAELKGVWAPGQDGQILNQFIVKKLKDDQYAKLRGDR